MKTQSVASILPKEYETYKDAGVDYDAVDPFKLLCQNRAKETSDNAIRLGIEELSWSRGESGYLFAIPKKLVGGITDEGLGTKNLVADAMYPHSPFGKWYCFIAQDAVAMAVNDIITVNAFPAVISMHLQVGNGEWFKNEQRAIDLAEGWKAACDKAKVIWGPGETPILKDILLPTASSISGTVLGVQKKRCIAPPTLTSGDAIIFLESSGIHANGLSLARKIADKLPSGYLTAIEEENEFGETYGEALLAPTHLYSNVVEDLQDMNVKVKYMVNITGHGWRKLMRLDTPFTYRITNHGLKIPPIFDFLIQKGPITEIEAYENLNMGAGFALYVAAKDADRTIGIINDGDYGFKAWRGGTIEAGEKQVIIESKGIVFKGESLKVR